LGPLLLLLFKKSIVSFAPPFFCHQNAKIHSKKKIKITIIIRIKAFIIQALFAFYGCNDKGMKKAL
jgi:hypothetical protein